MENKFVGVAVALNFIFDILMRIKEDHGVELTPENIADYIKQRTDERNRLNEKLGVM